MIDMTTKPWHVIVDHFSIWEREAIVEVIAHYSRHDYLISSTEIYGENTAL